MKSNFISDAAKILIFAATIIIICVLCAVGFKTAQEGKTTSTAATQQLNTMEAEYSNVDLSVFDGSTILGSELVSLITKSVDDKTYLSIVVRTLGLSRTDYNYIFDNVNNVLTGSGTLQISNNKAQPSYINRSAQFMGTAYKDTNNNIICLWFDQME